MLKSALIMAAATIAVASASAPAAAHGSDTPRIVVHYNDLDLSSASGRERLDTRVRTAIRSICYTNQRLSLRELTASRNCEKVAQRSAEPQLASLLNGSTAKFASDKPPVLAAP